MTQVHTLPTTARDGDLRAALDAIHAYVDAHDTELIEAGTTRDGLLRLARDLREAVDPIFEREGRPFPGTALAPLPAQDPVPALGLPEGEVEGLRARIIQAISRACAGQGIHIDGHGVMSMHGGVWPRFHEAIDGVLRTHVLAPPASAADGEGLAETIRLKLAEPCFVAFSEAARGNLTEAGHLLAFKVRPTGTASMWVRLASGREIIVGEDEWVSTTPPPVLPTRVAGLDREAVRQVLRSWHRNTCYPDATSTEIEAGVHAICALAPTPGETPGQDAVAGALAAIDRILEENLSAADNDAIRFSDGLLFYDLRLARTALASLRSTQADTGGESQTPAGGAVEALKDFVSVFEGVDTPLSLAQECAYVRATEFLDKAVASIEQGPGAGQAWQPIKTAPKDGTRLWLYWPKSPEDDRQAVGWWNDSIYGSWWTDHADSEKADPTHWMPLPTDPALVIKGEV